MAPGQGHIGFEEIFRSLKQSDYDGWISVEILPRPDPDTAAQQAAKFLLPFVRRYNAGIMEDHTNIRREEQSGL
jgi:sugar phosphate isomerase/epimerase